MNAASLPQELHALKEQVASLQQGLQQTRQALTHTQQALEQSRQENRILRQKLDALARRFFGKKSEQLSAAQLELLLQGLTEESPEANETQGEPPPAPGPPRPPRPNPRRVRTPENLEVVREVIEPELVLAEPEQWKRIGQRVSPACYIADAFPASLYLAWKYADDFEAGVIANTNVGGDNCHRGAVVGALLGAAAGAGRIPARFCDGLHDAAALRQQMHRWAV
jgi:hypothetical protein